MMGAPIPKLQHSGTIRVYQICDKCGTSLENLRVVICHNCGKPTRWTNGRWRLYTLLRKYHRFPILSRIYNGIHQDLENEKRKWRICVGLRQKTNFFDSYKENTTTTPNYEAAWETAEIPCSFPGRRLEVENE